MSFIREPLCFFMSSSIDVRVESSISTFKSTFGDDDDNYRRSYISRLSSFRPATYFGKPDSIAPPVCARHGWRNTALDMLTCVNEKCSATVCFRIDDGHSDEELESLAAVYRKQLSEAHKSFCHWRFCPNPTTFEAYPTNEASAESVRGRISKLLTAVGGEGRDLSVVTSAILSSSPSDGDEGGKEKEVGASPSSFPSVPAGVLALALTQWEVKTSSSDDGGMPMITCRCCGVSYGMPPVEDISSSSTLTTAHPSEQQPRKRRRRELFDPISSHRYFCPVSLPLPAIGEADNGLCAWEVAAKNYRAEAAKNSSDDIIAGQSANSTSVNGANDANGAKDAKDGEPSSAMRRAKKLLQLLN